MPEIKQDLRTATFIVAANDSAHKNMADYRCDGVNDHVEIQAALDALPATGGEVKLLDGTYNIEATINLDSNQTLRGCGRNTILTTTTVNLVFLSAVGGAGTEKTGIIITDLQIDGGAGNIGRRGIYFEYVDYSFIQNVYSRRLGNGEAIHLMQSDHNIIKNNMCQGNFKGISLSLSHMNIVNDNICQGNDDEGFKLDTSYNTIISGNISQGNREGFYLVACDYSILSGNKCYQNGWRGIYLQTSNIVIIGNTCIASSQDTDNTYANIYLLSGGHNLIQGNLCRDGGGANQPTYGIDIVAGCMANTVNGNDLYDSGRMANFNDAGTLTIVRDDNQGIEITQVRHYEYVKNTSGGDLVAGDVVVHKAAAAGNEITTTTTEGDQKVFGMAAGAIANNASGYVLVKGKTTVLKVDGTTDIAIGDLIGCFTTAKIGMKAASGKMAFAIALEAYAANDSNGVIDALLITPRQAI